MAGQPITLTLPAVGDPFPTAAAQVTTALTTLEVELERKVVPADMSMSADLSFLVASTNYRVKDLLASSYVLNASALSAVTYPRSVYFTGADGDLYANDGAGRQVRLTANGVVNTAASGNITSTGSPAYGTSSVELRWDGADLEYEMRSGPGANSYADVRLDDVILNDGSGNFIRVTSPSIATDYTLTLPTGVPGSANNVLQMSTAGALSVASTPTLTSLTTTAGLVVGSTAAISSNATVGGNIVVTGNVTGAVVTGTQFTGGSTAAGDLDVLSLDVGAPGIISAGGLSCSGNSSVTVAGTGSFIISGTGRYRHGNMTMVIPSSAFQSGGVYNTYDTDLDIIGGDGYGHWKVASGQAHFIAPVILPTGARIRSLVLTYFGGGNAGDRTFTLNSTATATDTVTPVSTVTGTSTTGVLTLSLSSIDHTMVSTADVWLYVNIQNQDYLKSVLMTYDFP